MAVKFPKYSLTDKQIRGLANIVAHEQGTDAGMHAEASIIANLTDIAGDDKATVSRLINTATGGWFAYGKTRYAAGTSNAMAIKAVKDVLVKGKRTIPRYVNEHDCLSDIKSISNAVKTNKSSWQPHVTKVLNRYGSRWTFYSFPSMTGCDPFGYKSEVYRAKWGEFCYSLEQSRDDSYNGDPEGYRGAFPTLSDNHKYYQKGDNGSQVKRIQSVLNWALGTSLTVDGKYGEKTEKKVVELQKKAGVPQNGKYGKLCLAYCKGLKK